MSGYSITRPEGDQILFKSSTTGEHVLDEYLEAAEKGGKELAELMGVLFDEETGSLNNIIFGIRVNPVSREIEIRTGTTVELSSWAGTGVVAFRWRGDHAAAQLYKVTDLVVVNGVVNVCVTEHNSGVSPDTAMFTQLTPVISSFMSSLLSAANASAARSALGMPAYPTDTDGVQRVYSVTNGAASFVPLVEKNAKRYFFAML